jgi:hypothetical protein
VKRRYENREDKLFGAIAGPPTLGDGETVPIFMLQIASRSLAFRAYFPNQAGSILRSIDYKHVDGRLFEWVVRDYTYPDNDSYYGLNKSVKLITATYEPDGMGVLETNDDSQPTVMIERFRDVPVEANWKPISRFGEWEILADPDY